MKLASITLMYTTSKCTFKMFSEVHLHTHCNCRPFRESHKTFLAIFQEEISIFYIFTGKGDI